MIVIDGKTVTPKQAAKLIIADGLGQSLSAWDHDTDPGYQLDKVMTKREYTLVNDQVHKIWRRIGKLLS